MLAKENNCEDLEEDVDLLECSDLEQVFGKVFRRDLWGSLSWGAPFRPQGPDIPLRLRILFLSYRECLYVLRSGEAFRIFRR